MYIMDRNDTICIFCHLSVALGCPLDMHIEPRYCKQLSNQVAPLGIGIPNQVVPRVPKSTTVTYIKLAQSRFKFLLDIVMYTTSFAIALLWRHDKRFFFFFFRKALMWVCVSK